MFSFLELYINFSIEHILLIYIAGAAAATTDIPVLLVVRTLKSPETRCANGATSYKLVPLLHDLPSILDFYNDNASSGYENVQHFMTFGRSGPGGLMILPYENNNQD